MRRTRQSAVTTSREPAVLKLSGEARDVFVRAVLNPRAPNKAARAAAKRYKLQRGR